MAGHTLVLGYGNRLRGDDGLGLAVADVVAGWRLPGVEVRTLHQLVPELAEVIAKTDRVLFIDAAVPDGDRQGFTVGRVTAGRYRPTLGHHETPENLLALVHALEDDGPDAWLLSITASSFRPGDALTQNAECNMREAIEWIRRWL
jgi:hydrogenase maturation protease